MVQDLVACTDACIRGGERDRACIFKESRGRGGNVQYSMYAMICYNTHGYRTTTFHKLLAMAMNNSYASPMHMSHIVNHPGCPTAATHGRIRSTRSRVPTLVSEIIIIVR